MRRYPKEVMAMHQRRKSDEHIETIAYILKHSPVNEDCIDDVSTRLDFIKTEVEKRRYVIRKYGVKENRNDEFIKVERARIKALLNAHRKKLVESTCKREASSQD